MDAVSIKRVVPRICGTCSSCFRPKPGRCQCTLHDITFQKGDELTSVCANWVQNVMIAESSVHTEHGEEPQWLASLKKSLLDERTKANFYYDMCEEYAKRKDRDG